MYIYIYIYIYIHIYISLAALTVDLTFENLYIYIYIYIYTYTHIAHASCGGELTFENPYLFALLLQRIEFMFQRCHLVALRGREGGRSRGFGGERGERTGGVSVCVCT